MFGSLLLRNRSPVLCFLCFSLGFFFKMSNYSQLGRVLIPMFLNLK